MDSDLGTNVYAGQLVNAVKRGDVQEVVINKAVSRILALKFHMGLFDHPFVDEREPEQVVASTEHLELAREVARQSIILLKNKNELLPLNKKMKTIAVIGPNADNIYNMLGDYTAPQSESSVVTVLDGIRQKVSNDTHIIWVSLLKRFLFSAAMLIWGSLFFAFIFIRGYEDTFIYLGGQHGYYLSEVMMNNIGIPGTVLLLVGLFLIVAIFTSKRTIPFLQNVFSFGWLKNRLKRDKSETTEVPEEEEDVEGEAEVYAPVEKTVAAPQPVAYRETVEENIGPDEYVFDTETEMRKAEVETEVPQKDDFEFEVARGDDPVVEAGNGNNTIFEVEVPEEEEEFDQSQLGKYDPRLDLSRYMFPTLDLLKFYDSGNVEVNREELEENQQMIKRTLEDFGINIASIKATVGPTVTLYEIIPEAGVRISKIKNLEDDIALSLSALQIRIIAPMPGKGTIGIEVPNNKPQTVSMQSVVASRKFQECTYDLPVAIGRTIVNEVFMFDLCKTPHLLVAGATGQGKSVGLNAIITSLLYKKHPAELKFVMVDPKQVEFSIYSKIERHYLAKLPNADKPIVTEPGDAVATLNSLVIENGKSL